MQKFIILKKALIGCWDFRRPLIIFQSLRDVEWLETFEKVDNFQLKIEENAITRASLEHQYIIKVLEDDLVINSFIFIII